MDARRGAEFDITDSCGIYPGYKVDEEAKWHNGYIKAYTDYANSEISITTGDYFKPIYDDGNNRLYVEKSTGESGWIYIEDPAFNRYVMNPRFFNVAG